MMKIIKDVAGNVLVQETREAFVMPQFNNDVNYSQRKELIKLEMEILKEQYRKFPPVSLDMVIYAEITNVLADNKIEDVTTDLAHDLIKDVFLSVVRNAPYYDEYNKYKERY